MTDTSGKPQASGTAAHRVKPEEVGRAFHNRLVAERLRGLHAVLMAQFDAGVAMSSSVKGSERELFVNAFLSQLFPPSVRFCSGDITDIDERLSGQVDIVAEAPFLFSFPTALGGPRLFLAEGVAAAIEVKSDLRNQWDQVVRKAGAVKALQRHYQKQLLEEEAERHEALWQQHGLTSYRDFANEMRDAAAALPDSPSVSIPFMAVGFEGWSDPDTLREKMNDGVDAILQLRPLHFACATHQGRSEAALIGFLEQLSDLVHQVADCVSPSFQYLLRTGLRKGLTMRYSDDGMVEVTGPDEK